MAEPRIILTPDEAGILRDCLDDLARFRDPPPDLRRADLALRCHPARAVLYANALGFLPLPLPEFVQSRIEYGRRKYGPWHLALDGRDLGREAAEDACDSLVWTHGRVRRAELRR